jgi:hypothetical protein
MAAAEKREKRQGEERGRLEVKRSPLCRQRDSETMPSRREREEELRVVMRRAF